MLKKEYIASYGTGKNTTSQTPSAALDLEGWTRYFRHRHIIKLYKNKTDSKVIKCHQCSMERSHAVLIEINSDQDLVTKTYKIKAIKIFLFNYSMPSYI